MSAGATHRLFFAVPLTPGARDALVERLRSELPPGARAVHPDDLHLTLAFLGSVPEDALPRLEAIAAGVDAPPSTVTLDRLEHWPGGLLCATGEASPELLRLHAELNAGLAAAGFRTEQRSFRAHVTLARDVPARPREARAAASEGAASRHGCRGGRPEAQPMPPLRLHVDAFVLMRSEPREGGARYTALRRWRLDKAGDVAPQRDAGRTSA